MIEWTPALSINVAPLDDQPKAISFSELPSIVAASDLIAIVPHSVGSQTASTHHYDLRDR